MAKKVIEPIPQNLKKEYIYSDEISTDTWIFNSKGQLLEVKFDWDKKYLKKYKDDVEFQLSLPKSKRNISILRMVNLLVMPVLKH